MYEQMPESRKSVLYSGVFCLCLCGPVSGAGEGMFSHIVQCLEFISVKHFSE